MQLRFLGACQEVGRSAVAVKSARSQILMDYGVMINHEVGFPVHVSPRELDAVVLTHAHLDHSGLIPLFYIQSLKLPVYAVEPTFKLTTVLVRDMIKLSGYYLPFEYIDLENMMNHAVPVDYHSQFTINDFKITLVNAGHIPGSAQVIAENDGKRILYTGDFNLVPTHLVTGADREYGNLDAIVIESTYATQDHPDRIESERNFVLACKEVVEAGGTVLVPAFGVGRSQEIICMLADHNFTQPVFVDGMALDAIRMLEAYPKALRDEQLFRRAMRNAEQIGNWRDRRRAARTPSVIVSPAGMLKGGASVFYMENIATKESNGIFLVSYQVEGSPGRILLDEGRFMLHGKARKVSARVEKFDFSSHGGKTQLEETLRSVDKRTHVFVIHGDESNCKLLADWASQELGLETSTPKPGEICNV
ncbi:MAG TPA: MBL fold metallo-hydrolase [Candidatus Acidoferrales bacterium]|nr:MBL fold metallo-hydrolase [Candidatus Acidoferrales bacterium]